MTYMFLIVILGATHGRAPVGFAGIAIGLALTFIHLISIPCHQYLRQSSQKYRSSNLCPRLGSLPTLALLAGTNRRRHPRRMDLPVAW